MIILHSGLLYLVLELYGGDGWRLETFSSALAGTLVSCLDVTTQSINSKVFWAIWALLPDSLVNSDVGLQIATFNQFWAVGTFFPGALVNISNVTTQRSRFKLLRAEGTLLASTIVVLLDVS